MKTDDQVNRDIQKKLAFEPAILDQNKIASSVHNGIVTLGGVVTSYQQKLLIEKAVKSIKGVKGIANEIKVEAAPQYKKDDVAIAKAAVAALDWDVGLEDSNIRVVVEEGWIKLSGEVKAFYQKEAAETCVRNLYGIKGIINQIEVKPSVAPLEVKNKILEEFKRNALIDAEQIEVKIDGNIAILNGKVRNWFEMQEAINAAWAVPGVAHVHNQLTIIN